MFKKSVGVSLLFLLTTAFAGFSQEIKPQGQFLEDSISIGKSIPYTLSIKHPRNIDVIFPDSLFDFSPYELEDKIYFPTKSDETHSIDSAVYYLTSFEVDPVQYISLPIYVLQGGDSVEILAGKDSVFLKQNVVEIPDSVAVEALPLKENTVYKRVDFQFNYPYFLIGLGIFLILLIVGILVFGRRVGKFFKLRRMKKVYLKYEQQFDDLLPRMSSIRDMEHLLNHWKKYLEKLEREPYTKLTTKEILSLRSSEEIEKALKGIDRTIYSNRDNEVGTSNFDILRSYSKERFELKVEEVKNG